MWCFLSFQSKRIFVKSMSLGADILKLVLQLQKNKGIDAEMKIIENSIFRYLDRISMSNTKEIRIIENLLKERVCTLDIWSGWWGDMTWQKKTTSPGSRPRPDMAQSLWSRPCKLEEQFFLWGVFWYYDDPQGLTFNSGVTSSSRAWSPELAVRPWWYWTSGGQQFLLFEATLNLVKERMNYWLRIISNWCLNWAGNLKFHRILISWVQILEKDGRLPLQREKTLETNFVILSVSWIFRFVLDVNNYSQRIT